MKVKWKLAHARLTTAAVLLHGAACMEVSLGTDATRFGGCFSLQDCPGDWVCFMGTCQPPGRNLSQVYVDILPPNDSDYLPHKDGASPRDLGAGLRFDVTMRAPKTLSGWVDGDSGPNALGEPSDGRKLSGVVVAHAVPTTAETRVLPSTRTDLRARVSEPGTFTLRFVPGTTYDLTFVPDIAENVPPRPPVTYAGCNLDRETQLGLQYPADEDLLHVAGRLRALPDQSSPVQDAEVRGTSSTVEDLPLVSTTATTGPEGGFEIVFPPGIQAFDLEIRPGANPTLPNMVFPNLPPTSVDEGLGEIVLNIPPESVTVEGTVRDSHGAAVPEAVVSFSGLVGSAEVQGQFAPTARTDSAGAFEVALLPGRYDVTVIPSPSQPQAMTSSSICVPDPAQIAPVDCGASDPVLEALELVLAAKIAVGGRVFGANQAPVADARVTFRSRNGPALREFLATTDGNGAYEVAVDAGTAAEPAVYEITVEPSNASGQPRHRELLQLGPQAKNKDLHLFAASFVSGQVLEPDGTPFPGVILALYAASLTAPDEGPLLVGLGQTGPAGEFVIPLPTPP